MNYGLLVYDYGENPSGYTGVNMPQDTRNIGDYIQSLSVKQFLPRVDRLVDRESIKFYYGEKIRLVMNGWWRIHGGTNDISRRIIPLFVSYHVHNTQNFPKETLVYLKENQPIGCRDLATRLFLKERGIDAYFSGCMSLTLGKSYSVDSGKKTDEIIFVDYPSGENRLRRFFTNKKIEKIISNLMRNKDQSKIIHLTHFFPGNTTHNERFALADKLLRRYAAAKMVVTSRLHCALPCVAMGTPVLLVNNKYDRRYTGLADLVNYAGPTEQDNFCYPINLRKEEYLEDEEITLINPQDHIQLANKLEENVRNFIRGD